MKRLFFTLFAIFASANLSSAQSQGAGLPLGGTGQAGFFITNESLTSLADADGDANYGATNRYGQLLTVSADAATGLSESVISVSNTTGMNGTMNVPFGMGYVTVDAAEAGSTTTVINATAHAARVGDWIKFRTTEPANEFVQIPVSAVTANTITLEYAAPATIDTGDAFGIIRPSPIGVLYNGINGTPAPMLVGSALEDFAAGSGDPLVAIGGFYSVTPQTALAGEGDYGIQKYNLGGAAYVDVNVNAQVNNANGLLKQEDGVHSSSDALVGIAGVRDPDGTTTFAGANGDYTVLGTSTNGWLHTNILHNSSVAGNNRPTHREDDAHSTADAGVAVLARRIDTLAASSGTSGDYETFNSSAIGALYTQEVGGTANGATVYKLVSAATTNATNVKASAGQIYGIQVYNNNASPRYVKFYNKASAPTVGTDVPVKVVLVPGNGGSNINCQVGCVFSTGISFATTTGAADSDTGAVALSEVIVNIDYK